MITKYMNQLDELRRYFLNVSLNVSRCWLEATCIKCDNGNDNDSIERKDTNTEKEREREIQAE